MVLSITPANFNQLIVSSIGLLVSLGAMYFKYIQQRRKLKMASRIRSFETDQMIYVKLQEILHKLNADRVYITEFCRNDKYVTKTADLNTLKSITKASITYEVVATGISSEQHNFQNVSVIAFIEDFNKMITYNEIRISDVLELKDSNTLKDLNKDKGNKSVYGFLMYGLDKKLLGLLMVNYVQTKHILSFEEDNYLKLSAEQIAGYI